MERVETGMLAVSRAGHDQGKLYLILKTEGDFAYLCDGRLRPREKPKKKRLKHLQVIRQKVTAMEGTEELNVKNEEIKRWIKEYQQRSARQSKG